MVFGFNGKENEIMSANFTPNNSVLESVSPFRHFCQKVMPLVYDDSLGYYELLCKVTNVLNQSIENNNLLGEDMEKLYEAYDLLQGYVNGYFDNLDVQNEINKTLDKMVEDGEFTDLVKPLVESVVTNYYLNDYDNIYDVFDNLDGTPKNLIVRKGETIELNKYVTIPSNTNIIGGGTLFFNNASVDEGVFNPALILLTGAENVKFEGVCIKTNISGVHSVVRVKNCDNISFKGCVFECTCNEGVSYNAVIDLHRNNTNISVSHNKISQVNSNLGVRSGVIWVQNAYNVVETDLNCVTKNVVIEFNEITSNCTSEFVAVYLFNNVRLPIENVTITNNIFESLEDRLSGFVFTSFAKDGQDNVVKNIEFSNNILKLNATNPTEQLIAVRIGGDNCKAKIDNLRVNNNHIYGDMVKFVYGLYCAINASDFVCEFIGNTLINTNENRTLAVGVCVSGSGCIIENNNFINFTTPLSEETNAKIGRNYIDNKDAGYCGVIKDKSTAKGDTGYLHFSNGIIFEWKMVTISCSGGAYVDVPLTNSWANGELLFYQVTPIFTSSITTTSCDTKLYATASGINNIRIYNFGTNYCTARLVVAIKKN